MIIFFFSNDAGELCVFIKLGGKNNKVEGIEPTPRNTHRLQTCPKKIQMTATNELKPNLREQPKEQLLERRTTCTFGLTPSNTHGFRCFHISQATSVCFWNCSSIYSWNSMVIFMNLHAFLGFYFQSQRMLYILELHCAFPISPIC